jgi:hypothetical protein
MTSNGQCYWSAEQSEGRGNERAREREKQRTVDDQCKIPKTPLKENKKKTHVHILLNIVIIEPPSDQSLGVEHGVSWVLNDKMSENLRYL